RAAGVRPGVGSITVNPLLPPPGFPAAARSGRLAGSSASPSRTAAAPASTNRYRPSPWARATTPLPGCPPRPGSGRPGPPRAGGGGGRVGELRLGGGPCRVAGAGDVVVDEVAGGGEEEAGQDQRRGQAEERGADPGGVGDVADQGIQGQAGEDPQGRHGVAQG